MRSGLRVLRDARHAAHSATFLTAWRKRGEAQLVRDSALPWLYTVTANRRS